MLLVEVLLAPRSALGLEQSCAVRSFVLPRFNCTRGVREWHEPSGAPEDVYFLASQEPVEDGTALLIGPPGHYSSCKSQRLALDLSNDEVAISTGFTGTELLLFGATEGTAILWLPLLASER